MESIAIPSLVEALRDLPEFRAARGKRHPLLPLLLLVCVAMLCGARGQSGIAAWGRDYGQPWLRRLGFTRAYGPSQSTLQRLFAGVAYAAVEAVSRRCSIRPACWVTVQHAPIRPVSSAAGANAATISACRVG